jgi:mono/diheme cytochrome c family protein
MTVLKSIQALLWLGLVSYAVLACGEGNQEPYQEGAVLYKKHCSNCHMDDGTGLEALYPPLAGSDMLESMDVAAACVLRNGLQGPIVVNGIQYDMEMPPMPQLSGVEITNLLNYIHNAWGNERAYISLDKVQAALERCTKK